MSGYESDEYNSGDEPDWPQMFVDRKNMTPDAIPGQIKNTKYQIANLLQINNLPQPDIDAGIAEKMTENEIDFNPNEPNQQTKLNKLTELKGKLEQKALQEKKGGKKHKKSKRYRKSKKQRKTKTKRRLRRSYKYKYK
jgi:hypothetical protein